MGCVFDVIGVQQDEKGNDCFIFMLIELMVSQFLGFDLEGMMVIYKCCVVIMLENVQFLSWDYLFVYIVMDVVFIDVYGKSSMGFIVELFLLKGVYWVEVLFVL